MLESVLDAVVWCIDQGILQQDMTEFYARYFEQIANRLRYFEQIANRLRGTKGNLGE